jgi:colanic acid/amylovoran biosynthesis glycosyltransferase
MMLRRLAYVLKIFPKLSETFIANELCELRRRGVELRILSLLPPREDMRHEFIVAAGLDHFVCDKTGRFQAVLDAFRPQLLHAHFATEATETARALAAQQGIPFTFTAHGYDIFRKPPADFSARAAAAGAVVTVSSANAEYIAATFAVPAGHIRVIPCGVDTNRFCPKPRPTPAGPPLVVCVARHVKVKNLELLLRSCALLRDSGSRFRCVLVGGGPCQAELEQKRSELGLQEWVEMPGAATQEEVAGWWRRASIGVLTSDNEGMPVSLMEAAACGVPVVATAVGGVPELVLDGVTGLLVTPGDPAALARALQWLLLDRDLREQMGGAARKRIENKFSLTRQVDSLVNLWSEVLG